jgi:hypothetical protein
VQIAALTSIERRQRLLYRGAPGGEDAPRRRPSSRRQRERHCSSVVWPFVTEDVAVGGESIDESDGG